MTKTKMKSTKSLSLILCMVLIAVMTLFTAGCSDDRNSDNEATASESKNDASSQLQDKESQRLGEGENTFIFTVTDASGTEKKYEIHTDMENVGEALIDLKLLDGEEGAYGLYVKTVDGITVDYDTDGKYWAFYIDGEYAMTGVDSTDIKEGSTYSFKVE